MRPVLWLVRTVPNKQVGPNLLDQSTVGSLDGDLGVSPLPTALLLLDTVVSSSEGRFFGINSWGIARSEIKKRGSGSLATSHQEIQNNRLHLSAKDMEQPFVLGKAGCKIM